VQRSDRATADDSDVQHGFILAKSSFEDHENARSDA
jgi:hypothetical protein